MECALHDQLLGVADTYYDPLEMRIISILDPVMEKKDRQGSSVLVW